MSHSTVTERAFSLAEVLVFIGLVVISVLGFVAVQIYAMRCSQFNRNRHTAATILESELNFSRALLTLKWTYDPGHTREPVDYQPDFESATECVYAPGSVDGYLKKVTTTVYWQDSHDNAQERSVSGWTYVYFVH